MAHIDGKSQLWRDGADKLLAALARENKYIVADMLIVFLEASSYGLPDYSPVGGVFKRAAKRGIIKKIDRPTKQALWYSQIYQKDHLQTMPPVAIKTNPETVPEPKKGEVITLKNFGAGDGNYRVVNADDGKLSLEAVS